MQPIPLVDEFRRFHVVAQEGVVAWNERDIDGAALGVVAVLGAANGIVQCLASEAAVYPESKEHSLYAKIQANIKSVSSHITLTCDTTWDGETHIYF